jgi:hypothetical protein
MRFVGLLIFYEFNLFTNINIFEMQSKADDEMTSQDNIPHATMIYEQSESVAVSEEIVKPVTDITKDTGDSSAATNPNLVADYFTNTINIFSDAFTAHMDVIGVHIDLFSDTINTHIETLKSGAVTRREGNRPVREMIPRMPWHDIHASVSGVVARDLSAHFVQVYSNFTLLQF